MKKLAIAVTFGLTLLALAYWHRPLEVMGQVGLGEISSCYQVISTGTALNTLAGKQCTSDGVVYTFPTDTGLAGGIFQYAKTGSGQAMTSSQMSAKTDPSGEATIIWFRNANNASGTCVQGTSAPLQDATHGPQDCVGTCDGVVASGACTTTVTITFQVSGSGGIPQSGQAHGMFTVGSGSTLTHTWTVQNAVCSVTCASTSKCNADNSGGFSNCGDSGNGCGGSPCHLVANLQGSSSSLYQSATYTVIGTLADVVTGASNANPCISGGTQTFCATDFSDGSHFYTGKDGFLAHNAAIFKQPATLWPTLDFSFAER